MWINCLHMLKESKAGCLLSAKNKAKVHEPRKWLNLPWHFPPYDLYSWIVKDTLSTAKVMSASYHMKLCMAKLCVFWARDAWNQKKLYSDRGGRSAFFLHSCESLAQPSAGLTEVSHKGHSEQCKLWPLCVSASWDTWVVEVATHFNCAQREKLFLLHTTSRTALSHQALHSLSPGGLRLSVRILRVCGGLSALHDHYHHYVVSLTTIP